MCLALHFTKLEEDAEICIDSQRNILTLLELQQAEQMAFSSIAHHSLSFPSSCPIVHFSFLTVTLGLIQHLLKLVENLPLTLFGFESCFLWSLLPLAMSETRFLLWPLNGLDYVCASFSFYFLYFSKGLSRPVMGKAVWNRYFIQKVERKPVIFFFFQFRILLNNVSYFFSSLSQKENKSILWSLKKVTTILELHWNVLMGIFFLI